MSGPGAGSVRPLPGAERIRLLTDEDAIFKAFDSYPWKKDSMFMSGLYALLGDSIDPNVVKNVRSSLDDMIVHARVFYYVQRVGVAIDFSKYKAWLAKNPAHQTPQVLPDGFATSPDSASDRRRDRDPSLTTSLALDPSAHDGDDDVTELASRLDHLDTDAADILEPPSALVSAPVSAPESTPESTPIDDNPAPKWQISAPKAPLYVDRGGPLPVDPDHPADEPNYPLGFAEMLRMLQDGETIPGIRQISDKVIRDSTSKPFGARSAPRKPWEKGVGDLNMDEVDVLSIEDRTRVDFPPLENAFNESVN